MVSRMIKNLILTWSMIEKFKFGSEGIGGGQNNVKPLPKDSRQGLSDYAACPPAILKKTFKRSVNAVLADSEIDEDGNSLFPPDGVPLLRVEDKSTLNEVVDDTSMDSDSQDSSHRRCSWSKVDPTTPRTPPSTAAEHTNAGTVLPHPLHNTYSRA